MSVGGRHVGCKSIVLPLEANAAMSRIHSNDRRQQRILLDDLLESNHSLIVEYLSDLSRTRDA